jgi:hypothetical protein
MTSERAAAYGVAMKSLRDLRPSKFTDEQMALFVECADALLFGDDEQATSAAAELYARACAQLDAILEADRLTIETVERLKCELSAIAAGAVTA